ncbi:MAG: hypothetical protein JXA73_14990 [Acidobacteria bacterium]|nr:hypothetical protein [Acidobacteriota bacterium]
MKVQNAHTSRHRDQDAAISAVVHAGALSAHASSRGGPMHIDAGRGFLSMGMAGGAAVQQPSRPDLRKRTRYETGNWK